MHPERVVDCHDHTGEGPLWHPDADVLYWVDIPDGELYRYDPAAGDHDLVYETSTIGGFTIQDDGSLLLFEDRGRIEVLDVAGTSDAPADTSDAPPSAEATTVIEGLPDETDSRFNDVIADPEGRVLCGTMPTDDRPGRLYRLETDATIERLRDDVALPNGLGFSPDHETLYFAESEARVVRRYDYDSATGAIHEREPLVSVDGPEIPDGLTVDAEGDVWVAFWNGGRIVRYRPDGTALERVAFPARKVSSLTFGGSDYDRAYATTALGPGEGPAGTRETEGEGAGALFRFDPGVAGRPAFRSRIRV